MAKSDKSKRKSPTPGKIKSAEHKKIKSADSNKSKSPVPKGKPGDGKGKSSESKAKARKENDKIPKPDSAKNKPPDSKASQKSEAKSDTKNKPSDPEQPSENGEIPEGEGAPEGEEIDPEAEALRATLRRVMVGSLEDLPPLGSKIVRIFTSSTFTDTTTERNSLMETVYPRLKEFCREKHGLEFQVFLGQKYGYRPIPTFILATEFDMIVDVVKEVPSDAALLQQWYKRDDNAVPPIMILQPISSILSNFNNKRHQRLMEKDQNAWWDIMGRLQKMLRKGAQILFLNRKLDREQMHNYFMSVTEREIRHGIINVDNTKDHCLAYLRQISNVNMTALRYARNFVDVIGREVDKEAERFLSILRDEHLPGKLPPNNIARFTVEWTGKTGIERETHAAYLKEFCDNFYCRISELVNRAVEENMKLASDLLYSEILQHLHTCMNFCKVFQVT
ncbi:hypothetical protein LSH36_143g06023 [Paralvinella palmiformis]|uniref:Uncharacterized protein n=1 Tax=Paralvinella palmiformis TaxID=53620 RepID=A0AAD9N7Q9_9ANNE|nr:hypothetical protein LSH36_143g06023 [Paralvinella palmiformis]